MENSITISSSNQSVGELTSSISKLMIQADEKRNSSSEKEVEAMYKQLDAQKEAAHKRMSQAIWSSVGGLVIGGAMSSMTGGLLTKGVKKITDSSVMTKVKDSFISNNKHNGFKEQFSISGDKISFEGMKFKPYDMKDTHITKGQERIYHNMDKESKLEWSKLADNEKIQVLKKIEESQSKNAIEKNGFLNEIKHSEDLTTMQKSIIDGNLKKAESLKGVAEAGAFMAVSQSSTQVISGCFEPSINQSEREATVEQHHKDKATDIKQSFSDTKSSYMSAMKSINDSYNESLKTIVRS
ncbi:hypothetical protein [Aliivibrio fischeri]|uniref:hypothetical protein n=1 Tax=Aliivibrio fischeri TaxID=668 RepID=UPI00166AEC25|nr:hypothetical protein [Aliivibrio fischeri]USR97958.1 hypothetical protein AVFI_15950 [Aliivibrio fischeri ATCC 7744 = JCM 18803 = DSM 507]GGK20222.1 hypothetical protein GCM10007987_00170 [Aliivibrio fischeri]